MDAHAVGARGEELAAEFLKGLVDLGEQGVCDRLVCIRTGKLLRRFFEKPFLQPKE